MWRVSLTRYRYYQSQAVAAWMIHLDNSLLSRMLHTPVAHLIALACEGTGENVDEWLHDHSLFPSRHDSEPHGML
jgi:hypothetical protein